jgi:hypothetical protein
MEPRKCEFHLISYLPDTARGEFINIGFILRSLEVAPEEPIVRFTKDWRRVLSIDRFADIEMLQDMEGEFQQAALSDNANSIIALAEETFSSGVVLTARKGILVSRTLDEEASVIMARFVDEPQYPEPGIKIGEEAASSIREPTDTPPIGE